MNTDELLAYNLKYDLPFVNTYDDRYAGVSLRQLEENTEKDACMYYELATRYRQGIGGAPTSPEKAYQYYQKVLYSQRNIRAMYWLGCLCLLKMSGKEREGMLYLKTADSLGDVDAPWLMGIIAFEHPDIEPTDSKKAYALFQRVKKNNRHKTVDRYLGRCAESLNMIDEARKHYTDGLNQGDKACANYLGYMYFTGCSVSRDLEYAKRFFSTGLESDEANQVSYAREMLAVIALENGTPKEKYDAVVYLKKNGANKAVNMRLGKAYFEGIPGYLEKDDDLALKYFEDVGKEDRGEACFAIALIYYSRGDRKNGDRYMLTSVNCGYGPACDVCMFSDDMIILHLKESLDEVVKTYNDKYDKAPVHEVKKAAESDPFAMYELARRYHIGVDGVEKNLDEAANWYRKTLWRQRNVRAMHFLALILSDEREEFAWPLWELAYSYGDVDAAVNLGIYYEFGNDGKFEPDLDKAMQLYRYAKEHGRKDGDLFIGGIYWKKGQFDLAEKRIRSAIMADRENAYPYTDLGRLYMDQKNPKFNMEEGIKWLKEGAKRGDEQAKQILKEIEEDAKRKAEEAAKRKAEEDARRTAGGAAAQKNGPTAEEILDAVEKLEENYSETLKERHNLLIDAEKLYPNHPVILEKLITVSNILFYGTKLSLRGKPWSESHDILYDLFKIVLDYIERLKKIKGMDDGLRSDLSFVVTHLAELAMGKNELQYAWDLLERADRVKTPWSAVVAMELLLRIINDLVNDSKLSERAMLKRLDGYKRLMKKEADVLRKTVEKEDNWNSQKTERALGYFMLRILYENGNCEPYIRRNPTLAARYLEKACELNPNLAPQ